MALIKVKSSGIVDGKVEVGSIISWSSSTVPSGYLECDGSTISRTTYSNLFNAISTTYGVGDGNTTFEIPDLRGEFIRGFDNSRGVDSGRSLGSFQDDLIKSHSHRVDVYGSGQNSGNVADRRTSFFNVPYASRQNNDDFGGVETRPKNKAIMFCIKF